MSSQLAVYLDGTLAGTLTQSRGGALSFHYDDEYLQGPTSPTPLSHSMPTNVATHTGRAVASYLDGLLPDNSDVREEWAARYNVSARNPFALLQHMGRDAAGAVQVISPGETADDSATGTATLTSLSDDEFSRLVASLADRAGDWTAGTLTGRWS